MRILLQRVSQASVSIGGNTISRISGGLLLLVGITHTDTTADADYLARKIASLRIFADSQGKMNRSITDTGGRILSVSQFTLYADTRKGNRPSFIRAAPPQQAETLYNYFNHTLIHQYGLNVATGCFGADMQVDLVNDGPVTILLENPLPPSSGV